MLTRMVALCSVEWAATEGFQGGQHSPAARGIRIGVAQWGRGDRTMTLDLPHIFTLPLVSSLKL